MLLRPLKSFLRKCTLPKKQCPHMEVAVRRWGPLRKWCRVLRGRLSIAYTHEPGQEGLATRSCFQSIVLTLDESEDAISGRTRLKIRDAMELVLLSLQASPEEAWEQVVRVLCGTPDFYPANHLPCELEPRVCVRHIAYGTFQYDTVDVFSSMWSNETRSRSYQRTRRWILENAAGSINIKPVPIKLKLTPTLVDMTRGSVGYLERAISMLMAISQCDSLMRLDSLALDLRALDIDSSCCRALRKMQQMDLRLETLLINPVDPHLADTQSSFVAMLDDATNPIERLVLDNSLGLAPASVWRALRHARALKEVEIVQSVKGSPLERNAVVQWQAYALLDPRSPSSIERVRFTDGFLARVDIAAMNEVLTSENPSRLLGLDGNDKSMTRTKRLKFLQLTTSPATDDEMNEILQLISAVGPSIETFAWSVDTAQLNQSHLSAVLKACPKLRRLRLQRAQLPEIDFVGTLYEVGLCNQLESLTLEDSVVIDRSSILRFVSACNDRTSVMHRMLKDFAYDNYIHEDVLADLTPIIAQNTTLRHIGLRLTTFGMARHREQLKQLHLAQLAMQHAPLPIDSKVAFMGVVLSKLNADVCHNIFDFAGEGVRRKVLCYVYDWIRLPNRFEL